MSYEWSGVIPIEGIVSGDSRWARIAGPVTVAPGAIVRGLDGEPCGVLESAEVDADGTVTIVGTCDADLFGGACASMSVDPHGWIEELRIIREAGA